MGLVEALMIFRGCWKLGVEDTILATLKVLKDERVLGRKGLLVLFVVSLGLVAKANEHTRTDGAQLHTHPGLAKAGRLKNGKYFAIVLSPIQDGQLRLRILLCLVFVRVNGFSRGGMVASGGKEAVVNGDVALEERETGTVEVLIEVSARCSRDSRGQGRGVANGVGLMGAAQKGLEKEFGRIEMHRLIETSEERLGAHSITDDGGVLGGVQDIMDKGIRK